MGVIKVRSFCEDNVNNKIVQRIVDEIKKIPGGESLLKDATELGDITINFTLDLVNGDASLGCIYQRDQFNEM